MYLMKIREIGATPRIMKREINAILKACWSSLGVFWHQRLRPKHFTTKGAKEYGYKPRAGEDLPYGSKAFWRSYTGRKKRKYGHTNPLTFSGRSRQLTEMGRITATRRGVRVSMNAPALNFKNPHSQIDMRGELTAVTTAEQILMAERFDAELQARIRRIDRFWTPGPAAGAETAA